MPVFSLSSLYFARESMNGSIPSTRTIARLPLARECPVARGTLDRRPPLGARSVQQCSRGRSRTRGHEDTAHSRIPQSHPAWPRRRESSKFQARGYDTLAKRVRRASLEGRRLSRASDEDVTRPPRLNSKGTLGFIALSLSLSPSHTLALLYPAFRSSYRPTFRHALITPVCACRRRRWQFKFAGGRGGGRKGRSRGGLSRRWRDAAASAA